LTASPCAGAYANPTGCCGPTLPEGLNLDLAFVYVAGERSSYARIHAAVGRLLARLNSELSEYSEYSEHF